METDKYKVRDLDKAYQEQVQAEYISQKRKSLAIRMGLVGNLLEKSSQQKQRSPKKKGLTLQINEKEDGAQNSKSKLIQIKKTYESNIQQQEKNLSTEGSEPSAQQIFSKETYYTKARKILRGDQDIEIRNKYTKNFIKEQKGLDESFDN